MKFPLAVGCCCGLAPILLVLSSNFLEVKGNRVAKGSRPSADRNNRGRLLEEGQTGPAVLDDGGKTSTHNYEVVSTGEIDDGHDIAADNDLPDIDLDNLIDGIPPDKRAKATLQYFEYLGREDREIMMREGLGESGGIPGIEYLGLGYNVFEGNPHGSEEGPIDPGFRSRVISLIQNQETTTISQNWLRPLGISTTPLRACEFSSSSVEISNSKQYKTELSKEVKQKYSASLSGQGVVQGVPAQLSTSFSFEKSRKFESFREGLVENSEISYEAKAICTNFHAQFEPYYVQTPTSAFEKGLDSLPVPYDKNDETHRSAYESFIEFFGTHIVSEVSIGAKHIFTSKITTKDVLDLTRDKVDIANSMSFDLQASIFGDATKAKEQIAAVTSKGGSNDNSITVIVTNQVPESDDGGGGGEGGDLSGILGATGSFSTTQESSTSSFSEAQEKIKSKITTIEEVNIGGTPPADGNWKTWASGLVPKGMPVQWSLSPIWDFMTANGTDAFAEAFIDIYGLDITSQGGDDDALLSSMHFGVADGAGRPISSYSTSAGSNYRTLVVASSLPRSGEEDSSELDVVEGFEVFNSKEPADKNPVFCDPGDFVCGFDVYYDDYKATALGANFVDEEGIAEMKIKCCQATDWSIQATKVVQDDDGTSGGNRGRKNIYNKYKWASKTCPQGGFVIGARGKEYPPSVSETKADNQKDPMGLTGLDMICSTDRDSPITVYNSQRGNVNGGEWREAVYAEEGLFVRGVSVRYVSPNRADGAGLDSKDDQGITGLTLILSTIEASGADHTVYTRKIVAESPNGIPVVPFATAIRGNLAPHMLETDDSGLAEGLASGEFQPFSFFRPSDDATNPTVAIMDFEDSILSASSLDAFSFLAVRNPPDNFNVIASVIHPQGYPINELYGSSLGFDVEMNSNTEFVLKFAQGALSGDLPTVLTMPAWFSSASYPMSTSDLLVSPQKGRDNCNNEMCLIKVGGTDSTGLETSLGFSVLAISGNAPGLIHGRILINADGMLEESNPTLGYTATAIRGTDDIERIFILFETAYDAIPSVIATPLAVVEHVSKKEVCIKKVLDTELHFVVVGPPPLSETGSQNRFDKRAGRSIDDLSGVSANLLAQINALRRTESPSEDPTMAHSSGPSSSPSENPSAAHSFEPSSSPTSHPTGTPTVRSTSSPSLEPSSSPSSTLSSEPSSGPSSSPSSDSSSDPSSSPSSMPSDVPSAAHSDGPSSSPSTTEPSNKPSTEPSMNSSVSPSTSPSTSAPSNTPSDLHSMTPSSTPSIAPTTRSPTLEPTTCVASGDKCDLNDEGEPIVPCCSSNNSCIMLQSLGGRCIAATDPTLGPTVMI